MYEYNTSYTTASKGSGFDQTEYGPSKLLLSKYVTKDIGALRKDMPKSLDGLPALTDFLRAWAPDTPTDAHLTFCTAAVSAFFDFDLLQVPFLLSFFPSASSYY